MSSDTKNRIFATSALMLIMVRAEALAPADFVAPSDPINEDYNILGKLSNSLRRLYTVNEQLDAECRAKHMEVRELAGRINPSLTTSNGYLDLLTKIASDLNPKLIVDFKQRVRELQTLHDLQHIVHHLFMYDLKAEYDQLADKSDIVVFNDWHVGWKPSPEQAFGFTIDASDDSMSISVSGPRQRSSRRGSSPFGGMMGGMMIDGDDLMALLSGRMRQDA